MKNKKIFLVLLLILTLFMFSGCGNDGTIDPDLTDNGNGTDNGTINGNENGIMDNGANNNGPINGNGTGINDSTNGALDGTNQ